MTRLIKAAWFVSLLVSLAALLYVYASIPVEVIYRLDNFGNPIGEISRETFFYVSLIILVVANFSLYTVSRSLQYRDESIKNIMTSWQLSFALVLNFFFIIIWNFISLVNSGEHYAYTNSGYLIYVALGLIALWVLALPLILIKKKISS
ncbi:hypothetical protein LVD15_19960 [Fulvivirga maritima]|uniref:hypothetical protein n=1 Tax=Fulvivirga maritima TaxID=2904247 RepID=UPI001F46C55E|nr:hypothetical protein [Fulvivirga maritima]UII25562.1 hypothetical protein LVD15_19960 [Fulvivirga maritima]